MLFFRLNINKLIWERVRLNKALGGYFELELPATTGMYYPQALKYQSARSAFYALLLHCKPKRVWMPYYICDSMLTPLEKAGIEIAFYSLNSNFTIADDIELKSSDKLLYVNYFGLCSAFQNELLKRYDPQQIIFDHSQAFFCQPKECLATLYSARKFFGVPDGGFLITNLELQEPTVIDEDSIDRSKHLLQRLAGEPEDGYVAYQQAEESLQQIEPKRMSLLTERILASIDYQTIKNKREFNFRELHSTLGEKNEIDLIFDNIEGPMIYPYFQVTGAAELKAKLISERCFVATYWPECRARLTGYDLEKSFVENLVPFPCDQRIESYESYLSSMD